MKSLLDLIDEYVEICVKHGDRSYNPKSAEAWAKVVQAAQHHELPPPPEVPAG